MLGKPAAFDSLPEASVIVGSAAFATEEHKHRSNDGLGVHLTCSGDVWLLGYKAFWESTAIPVHQMCFLMGGKGQNLQPLI